MLSYVGYVALTVLGFVLGGFFMAYVLFPRRFYWGDSLTWLSETGRRILCGLFGVLFFWFGFHSVQSLNAAATRCRSRLHEARNKRDSTYVWHSVPDSTLHAYRGRPRSPLPTCRDVLWW